MKETPVTIIFFKRKDVLVKLFDELEKVKPKKIYLVQDGPNNNEEKKEIELAREYVESRLNWNSQITKIYSNINLGCGKRISSGLNKVFEKEDKSIILEDDCIPSQSFFGFCEILLNKYKDDIRVSQICGMNHLGVYKSKHDYIFTNTGSCWGWATWRRVWQKVDYEMSFLDDKNALNTLKSKAQNNYEISQLLHTLNFNKKLLNDGKKLSAWTYQFNASKILNNQVNIVPSKNLISNIGLGSKGTNTASKLNILPKNIQKVYFSKTYEMDVEKVMHPEQFYIDHEYHKRVNKMMGLSRFGQLKNKFEYLIRRLLYG